MKIDRGKTDQIVIDALEKIIDDIKNGNYIDYCLQPEFHGDLATNYQTDVFSITRIFQSKEEAHDQT